MNTILNVVLIGASVVFAAVAQTASKQANPPASGSAQDHVQPVDAREPAEANIQSTMENGVLVVRYGVGSASHRAAAGEQLPAEPAVASALRVALDRDLARRPAAPSLFVRTVRSDEPRKYVRPRERSQEELKLGWTYRPKTDWTYHPVPERSREEVERLTTYRRTLP